MNARRRILLKRRVDYRSRAVMGRWQQTRPGWCGPPSSRCSWGWRRWVRMVWQTPSPPIRMTPPVRRSPGRLHARVACTTLRRQCRRPRRRCPRRWAAVYREARCPTAHPTREGRPQAACPECPEEFPACRGRSDARPTPLSATGEPRRGRHSRWRASFNVASTPAARAHSAAMTAINVDHHGRSPVRDAPAENPRSVAAISQQITRVELFIPVVLLVVACHLSETRSPTAQVRRGAVRGGGGS